MVVVETSFKPVSTNGLLSPYLINTGNETFFCRRLWIPACAGMTKKIQSFPKAAQFKSFAIAIITPARTDGCKLKLIYERPLV